MELTEIVARNIRRIRYEKSLTQEELADKAELSARYIGKIEQGKVSPTLNAVGRIADALVVDPRDLLDEDRPTAER